MAVIKKWSGMVRGEAILAVMATLMDDDSTEDFYVGGRPNGLHVQLWSNERKCTIAGHGNSDSYVIIVGGRDDFEFRTNDSKDTAREYYFGYDQVFLAAKAAVRFLKDGIEPQQLLSL